jgi:rod shape-determining protein MreB
MQGLLENLGRFAPTDLAIDLGTANTLVYRPGHGIVFNEPAVIASNVDSGEVVAVGSEAWSAVDRSPGNVVPVRPLRRGVITDFDVTQKMLKVIMRRAGVSRVPGPRVLVCVPSTITEVERRALEAAARSAGARTVILAEEPLAAAIGAGLPVNEPVGNLIVDIGGGMSEIAVVSMGGVVDGRTIRTGGFDMDAAIQDHLKETYEVAIGEKTAERIKIAAGSAYPMAGPTTAVVRGRELSSGLPSEVELSDSEIREALSPTVRAIVESARDTLADAPPELTHDVLETGIFLTGGGALLRGLDMLLAQECEVPVHVTERALETVVIGAGRIIEDLGSYATAVQTEKQTSATRRVSRLFSPRTGSGQDWPS